MERIAYSHHCPARYLMHGARPSDSDRWLLDYWSTHRWDTVWPGGVEEPRVCSRCGGIHPEDALRLLEESSWELRATGEPNRLQMIPPDLTARLEHLMKLPPSTERLMPYPDVVLDTAHMSGTQLDRLTALIRERLAIPHPALL